MKLATKKILLKCGVGAHLSGFEYLGEAIELVMDDQTKLKWITKLIYPEVAKHYNSTWQRVERAIRHAIECVFNNIAPGAVEDIYGNSLNPDKGKATNAQFIATIVELYGDEIRAEK